MADRAQEVRAAWPTRVDAAARTHTPGRHARLETPSVPPFSPSPLPRSPGRSTEAPPPPRARRARELLLSRLCPIPTARSPALTPSTSPSPPWSHPSTDKAALLVRRRGDLAGAPPRERSPWSHLSIAPPCVCMRASESPGHRVAREPLTADRHALYQPAHRRQLAVVAINAGELTPVS
jgi:hypothetical protein